MQIISYLELVTWLAGSIIGAFLLCAGFGRSKWFSKKAIFVFAIIIGSVGGFLIPTVLCSDCASKIIGTLIFAFGVSFAMLSAIAGLAYVFNQNR